MYIFKTAKGQLQLLSSDEWFTLTRVVFLYLK